MSTPPPAPEPWESALKLATVALGRGGGVMLDIPSRDSLTELLRIAWERAQSEGRGDDYEDAASQLVSKLLASLKEQGETGRGTEYRDGRPQASIRPLPPESFSSAIRSVCPLWPFC